MQKSSSKQKFAYLILLIFLFSLTVTVGILCLLYERKVEGIIIICCSLCFFSIGYFLHLTQKVAEKHNVCRKAGNVLSIMTCDMVMPGGTEIPDVLIGLHENGVFIDYTSSDYTFIPYAEISKTARLDSLRLAFYIDELKYVMKASSEVKRIAFESIFKMYCHFDTVEEPLYVIAQLTETEERTYEEGDADYGTDEF